jgi:hypothetical protein
MDGKELTAIRRRVRKQAATQDDAKALLAELESTRKSLQLCEENRQYVHAMNAEMSQVVIWLSTLSETALRASGVCLCCGADERHIPGCVWLLACAIVSREDD